MYIYYILRGTQNGATVELEDEITEEQFPDVDLSDALAIINHLMQKMRAEGTVGEWEACDLTDSAFESEDSYIYINNRWMRRSDAPWRKDKFN